MNTRKNQHQPAGAMQAGFDSLADQMSELARSLHHHVDGEDTLIEIVDTALRLIPEASDASISLVRGRKKMESRAASGDLPRVVDAIQSDTQQGPCLEAAFNHRVVRVPDISDETRWPLFARGAWDAGARSMLCFQLFIEGKDLGALNLYATETHAFGEEAEQVGTIVATHAAIALVEAKETSGLNLALVNRDLIGQAKGILMERYKISSHQAFLLLTTASSKSNMKLAVVAEHLALTGDLAAKRTPDTPPAR